MKKRYKMSEQKERRLTVIKDNLYKEELRKTPNITPPEKYRDDGGSYLKTITPPNEYENSAGTFGNVRDISGGKYKKNDYYTDSPTAVSSSGGLPDKTDFPDSSGYQTNPMYEKLLKFRQVQQKKRFTVDDLLKW